MKKILIGLIIVTLFIFLVGCLDYKAYQGNGDEELDLLEEIAQIEKELGFQDNQEVLLDEFGEELEITEEDIELNNLEEESIVSEETQIIRVNENELIKLNVKVSDPDQDEVTYRFTSPINNNGEWKTNYGDAGEYLVTLTATDGKLTTEKIIKLVVDRVNVPPVIEPLKDLVVNEGETVTLLPKIKDPNNDPISISISEPLRDEIFVTDHTSAGEYRIVVLASDGELETEQTFKLTVNNVNELPVIKNLTDLVVKEGEIVEILPEVSDLDGDKVALTISEPIGDDGVWETTYTDHGEYLITVTANDGADIVTKKLTLTVEDVNMPPKIVDVSLSIN